MKLPQLSVRDLFWLVLVVGMGLGWSVHSWRIWHEGWEEDWRWYLTAATMSEFIEENGFGEVLFDRDSVTVDGRELPRARREVWGPARPVE